jgi:hypothetical protein
MFIVEGRTLGVLAAVGTVLLMVVVFDRLSEVGDLSEPGLPTEVTGTSTTTSQALRHNESALVNPSLAASRPSETVPLGEKLNSHQPPLKYPIAFSDAHALPGE